ncbi:CopY/TcrY family copper transport repressor [Carnobacteriaceae bacterium 52-44]|jgi:CopY/TcrY family copper transport repressor
MQTTAPVTISEAEWEIMRVVWANVSVTSREVIDILEDKMGWKESTIKTLIGRLVDKEVLETKKEGRKFIYTANINEADTVKSYSEDILSRVCNKHNGLVISHFIKEAQLSTSDIEELIKILEEKSLSAPEVVPCDCVPGQCECHLVN